MLISLFSKKKKKNIQVAQLFLHGRKNKSLKIHINSENFYTRLFFLQNLR
jgi:hypothetical protein